MIYGQLGRIGRVVGIESAQSCVLHNYYIHVHVYINLCLVISPSRAPASQIYLWNTFRRHQTRLLSLVTSPYVRLNVDYMWRLLPTYKTKPVIYMIIKRNVKINALFRYLLYELGASYTCSLFTSGNPNLCAIDLRLSGVNKFIFRPYIHEVYT